MKSLLALSTVALIVVGIGACGETDKEMTSTARTQSGSRTVIRTTRGVSGAVPSEQSLLGDGDADNPDDIDGDGTAEYNDGSEDHDKDSMTAESYDYADKDDEEVLNYGHPTDTADRQAITAIVKHYYAAAANGDGAMACPLIAPSLAKSIPEAYGGGSGPSYLRGGRTCQAVMSALFKHVHDKLTGHLQVTAVRISGKQAEALLGSTTMPASEIALQDEHGGWKIEALLSHSLP